MSAHTRIRIPHDPTASRSHRIRIPHDPTASDPTASDPIASDPTSSDPTASQPLPTRPDPTLSYPTCYPILSDPTPHPTPSHPILPIPPHPPPSHPILPQPTPSYSIPPIPPQPTLPRFHSTPTPLYSPPRLSTPQFRWDGIKLYWRSTWNRIDITTVVLIYASIWIRLRCRDVDMLSEQDATPDPETALADPEEARLCTDLEVWARNTYGIVLLLLSIKILSYGTYFESIGVHPLESNRCRVRAVG